MGRPNTDVRWDQKTIIYVDELEYQVSIKNAQLEDAKTEIKSLKEQLEKKNIILTNSRAGNNSLEFENKLLKQQLEKEKTRVIILENDLVGKINITECCEVGPITCENYCPNCGKQILTKTQKDES